jgi:5'(3')-deoxyribonucleotidase
VEEHLGWKWCGRLIICPDKSLLKGDYLVDDYNWEDFEGELIRFGSEEFPNWKQVKDYLINKVNN